MKQARQALVFTRDLRVSWFSSIGLGIVSAVAWFGVSRGVGGDVGPWVVGSLIFLTLAVLAEADERKLTVTPERLEVTTLTGWKRIHRLDRIQSVILLRRRETWTGPEKLWGLNLRRNALFGFTVTHEWVAAYPAILEATRALNPQVTVSPEVLEAYGE